MLLEYLQTPKAAVTLCCGPEKSVFVCTSGGKTATATLVLFDWVADWLRAQCGSLDGIEVIIIAAPQHQVRTVWCAKQAGFKDIHLPKLEFAPDSPDEYWSRSNKHWCTWGPGWWKFYETCNWVLMNVFPKLYRKSAKARTH